jgi:uncharacterized protein YjbJ (UPF0337 family)
VNVRQIQIACGNYQQSMVPIAVPTREQAARDVGFIKPYSSSFSRRNREGSFGVSSDTDNRRIVRMDWNQVEGNWKEVKGKVKQKWAKLTDDDLTEINGKRDQLEGRLQQRYGYAKDQARKDVDTWFSTLP